MEQHASLLDAAGFKDANKDYLKRIEKQGLRAVYDATLDTLFLEIGSPREALTEHVVDNIMARVDPESLEIVGLEILDFMDDFLPANRLVRESLRNWDLNRQADSQWTLMASQYAPVKDIVEAAIGHLALRSTNPS